MQHGLMGGSLQMAFVFWLVILDVMDRSDAKRRPHASKYKMDFASSLSRLVDYSIVNEALIFRIRNIRKV